MEEIYNDNTYYILWEVKLVIRDLFGCWRGVVGSKSRWFLQKLFEGWVILGINTWFVCWVWDTFTHSGHWGSIRPGIYSIYDLTWSKFSDIPWTHKYPEKQSYFAMDCGRKISWKIWNIPPHEPISCLIEQYSHSEYFPHFRVFSDQYYWRFSYNCLIRKMSERFDLVRP